jgi:hypothetical protein
VAIPDLDRAPEGTVTVAAPAPVGTVRALARLDRSAWAASLGVAALAFVVVGVPTAVIPNPVFGRLVATRWWDPIVLAISSVLLGLVWVLRAGGADRGPGADPDVGSGPDDQRRTRRSVVGGALTFLAVGCPTCNKLVLAALGTSGALTWFGPVQPVLGMAGIVVLAVTLRQQVWRTGLLSCRS